MKIWGRHTPNGYELLQDDRVVRTYTREQAIADSKLQSAIKRNSGFEKIEGVA